jgi:hypothetical protein
VAQYDRGSLLELEDQSRWEVLPGHEIFTAHWVPRARVTVVPGNVPGYPYDLINTESGDRVPVRSRGIPAPRWSISFQK